MEYNEGEEDSENELIIYEFPYGGPDEVFSDIGLKDFLESKNLIMDETIFVFLRTNTPFPIPGKNDFTFYLGNSSDDIPLSLDIQEFEIYIYNNTDKSFNIEYMTLSTEYNFPVSSWSGEVPGTLKHKDQDYQRKNFNGFLLEKKKCYLVSNFHVDQEIKEMNEFLIYGGRVNEITPFKATLTITLHLYLKKSLLEELDDYDLKKNVVGLTSNFYFSFLSSSNLAYIQFKKNIEFKKLQQKVMKFFNL